MWHARGRTRVQVRSAIEQGIAELLACGTTHVGDITASWLSLEPLLVSGLCGTVYLEVLGLDRDRALARLELAQDAILEARERPGYGPMQVGLSLHAPYSCHPDLLREGAAWCHRQHVPLCLHAAESPAESKLLLTGRAPTIRWHTRLIATWLGVWPSSVPGLRPIPYLASLGVLDAQPLLAHAVHVSDADIQMIASAGCSVVHCPRSNHRLSCGRMPLERYLAAGVPVCLGTDSRASSPDLDVCAEAAFAASLHADRVDREDVASLVHSPFPLSRAPVLPRSSPA